MFVLIKEGGGKRRGQEYGAEYGNMTMRDLMTRLLVEDSENWGDLDWLEIRVSGRFTKDLPISQEAKAEFLARLEYLDADGPSRKVPLEPLDYILDLPGGATAMKGTLGCAFTLFTTRRVIGTMHIGYGRRGVVHVPRSRDY
jgi:hypothetical protein